MIHFIDKVQKITDDYGQLHEEGCDLNSEDGSFDGCDCAMKSLSEEVAALLTQQRDELKEKCDEIVNDEKKYYWKGIEQCIECSNGGKLSDILNELKK